MYAIRSYYGGNDICETDSYETCERCPEDCCPDCGNGTLDSIGHGKVFIEQHPGRITSYNVCYTKLLRQGHC